MMKVASYDAHANDGEPQVHLQIRRPTRWRVEIQTKLPGEALVNTVIRVEDKLPLRDVYEIARDALTEQVPDGTLCEIGRFALWADA